MSILNKFSTQDLKLIKKIAIKTNNTLLKIKNKNFLFQDYPKGSCRFSADLLAIVYTNFNFNNIKIVYNGRNSNKQSHAWLEIESMIIDITCSQFTEWNDIFIGKSTKWHQSFKKTKRINVNPTKIGDHWSGLIPNFLDIVSSILK